MEHREDYQPAPPRRSSSSVNTWLVAVLLLLIGVLLWRLSDGFVEPLHNPDAEPRTVSARGDLAADELSTIELFKNASPSVVHVTTHALARSRFSLNVTEIPQGSGSGFVWDAEGHVVTNFHVVQSASSSIKVLLSDNTSWDARVVGVLPENDLAVLKIDAPPSRLKPIPIGTSTGLMVGQKVFAIGNPFSLDQTLTTGIISGLGRELDAPGGQTLFDLIQTDAAINPGNSGGPLLDSAGRLIGVNTAIVSPSGAYAGVGFAVPVDTINQYVPQLIRNGSVDRPGLGITIVPENIVERLVQAGELSRRGALVLDVMDDSAAGKAGIRATHRDQEGELVLGDLIVGVDGEEIEESNDLMRVLGRKSVGDTVNVTVYRDGGETELEATLQPLPSSRPRG